MWRQLGRRILSFYPAVLAVLGVIGAGQAASAGSEGVGLHVPGAGAVLDRMAYAVDGAESSHGADPRMWRSEPDGPQGPMQVSAAAAADAGGGDRFDEKQNRALGRAYLARMFRRYGSWPDALAAYNWGPGNLDMWISSGRPTDKFPQGVARYRARVLVASGLQHAEFGDGVFGGIYGRLARLKMLRLQAKRQLADRRRLGSGPDAVELLYTEIMRATDLTVR